MNITKQFAGIAALALLALPVSAFAQVYYYSSGNSYGSYDSSYIPASAMPYVEYGNEAAQQAEEEYLPEYSSYSSPSSDEYQSQSQSQSQSQYETSYPDDEYGYTSAPGYEYSSEPSYSTGEYDQYGEYASEPQSISYPSGTTGPFGEELCYWSDSSTYEPCGQDPQQWIQDPYTGGWY